MNVRHPQEEIAVKILFDTIKYDLNKFESISAIKPKYFYDIGSHGVRMHVVI